MDQYTRYPAPTAEWLWSRDNILRNWTNITTRLAAQFITEHGFHDTLPTEPGSPEDTANTERIYTAVRLLNNIEPPDLELVDKYEKHTEHEIVGFLTALVESRIPQDLRPYVHYGLTSSDLVEGSAMLNMRYHLEHIMRMAKQMVAQLNPPDPDRKTPRVGRTHGQIAAPTTLEHQLAVFSNALQQINRTAEHTLQTWPTLKSPGPTGYTNLRSMAFSVPATQILPRDYYLNWASIYLRYSNWLVDLATWVRLGSRSEVEEISEGTARNRVGSSAMPGKRNPIASEKTTGLGRVAFGHFVSLANVVGLWEERDLSNSSTDRIAIPGLAGTVEHMMQTMIDVMSRIEFDTEQMKHNLLQNPRSRVYHRQAMAQALFGLSPIAASKLVTSLDEKDRPTEITEMILSSRFDEVNVNWVLKVADWLAASEIAYQDAVSIDEVD